MTLYRATYLRGDSPRGVTFAAETLEEALDFSCFWEAFARVDVLTLKAVPVSSQPLAGVLTRPLPLVLPDDEASEEALRSVR